ncbi:MAG: hypothetical protein ABJA82_09235 [Myxococcales bacterium]
MKNPIVRGILLLASASALGACSPAAPTNPTWEQDIHPLIVARCIRCHYEGGNLDPLTTGLSHATPKIAYNFNYPTLANPPQDGLKVLKALVSPAVRGPRGPKQRMPPPPAEALEDWQIDMLANWAAQPTVR